MPRYLDTLDIYIDTLNCCFIVCSPSSSKPIRFLVQPYNDQATATLDRQCGHWTLCNVRHILSGPIALGLVMDTSLCKGQIFVCVRFSEKSKFSNINRQLCQQLWDFVYIEEYDTALQQYIHSVRRGVVKSFLRSYFFFEVEIM